ncbi:biotin--[acetyl-CoA-carboxylase] ligase [Alloscardovia criceti]|uniref:biotin--[acetyl-CoA-carboxylase] ligase n=1 Tax=Alloscardovia criceti TaxID=356828 RepID=UPI0003771F62|nr:biotin--[acetyl-CoA-carboxylase] ligase [Alloscardovia criceti]
MNESHQRDAERPWTWLRFDSLGSTNSTAVQVLKEKLETSSEHLSRDNSLVFIVSADQQTQGRGRLGRTWVSLKNAGMSASFVCAFDRGVYDECGSWISLCAGLAARTALRDIAQVEAHLKWPNDLYIDGQKLGGILCESVMHDDTVYVVIGIGINIDTPDDLPDKAYEPTGVKAHATSELPNNAVLIHELIVRIAQELEDGFTYKDRQDWRKDRENLHRRAREASCTLGQRVDVVRVDGTRFSGLAQDIGEHGELQVLPDSQANPVFISVGDVFHARLEKTS